MVKRNKTKKIILTIFILSFSALSYSQVFFMNGMESNATSQNLCVDGSIELEIIGGFPPFEIIWTYKEHEDSNESILSIISGISGQNDGEDLDGIEPGIYTATINDQLCGTIESSYLIICECPECELIGEVENVTCRGMNGAINVTLQCEQMEGLNTNQMYTYLWSDLDPSVAQSASRDNLSMGEYCLTVTDESGCEYTNCWTVENEVGEFPSPTIVAQSNIPFCYIDGNTPCTGSITISVPDGASFTWINIPNQNQTTSTTVTDLCVGDYQVEVLNDLGCGFIHTYSVVCCLEIGQDEEQDNSHLEVTSLIEHDEDGNCSGSVELNINSTNDATIE